MLWFLFCYIGEDFGMDILSFLLLLFDIYALICGFVFCTPPKNPPKNPPEDSSKDKF